MTYLEHAVSLMDEVSRGELSTDDAIHRLHQYSDGGLTREGAALYFEPIDHDGQGNTTW